jgi:hypothetical protein
MSRRFQSLSLAGALCFLTLSSALAADAVHNKKQTLLQASTPTIAAGALDCAQAPVLFCGARIDSTTVGATNSVSHYGCVAFDESGGEAVYRLELSTHTEIDLRLSGMSADLDLFVLAACDAGACLRSSASVSSERIIACMPPGDYIVVVDGFAGQSSDFHLEFDCTPCVPCAPAVSNDGCGSALKIASHGETQILSGSTCCANDSSHGNSCSGFPALGLDVAYRLDLPPGCAIEATLRDGSDGKDLDLSIYMATSCADLQGTCVAGSDTNAVGAESFSYSSITGGTYYLIVDSFGNQTCGDYELEIFFTNCSLVSVESRQWTHVKQLYR